MKKKLASLLICFVALSYCSITSAYGAFTWFGLRNKDTEVSVQHSTSRFAFWRHDDCCECHHHKPKPPKHKPPHKHHKKGPKPHRGWRK